MDHLEPGFDPNTLTVPRLRSVLVAHSVPYPSSAKKSQLIDIFNQHVAPQAGRLRSAQSHVTRTSNGIEDVASQTDTVDDEQPRRTTRARTEEGADTLRRVTRSRDTATPVEPVRRSTRVREDTAELYEAAEPRRSTRHRDEVTETPRRSRSKHARTTEGAETMEREAKRRASRASRLAAATPAAEESPFSRENVFQSGGSPPTATESRRRTTGRLSVRRKSRDDVVARRRTTDLRSTHEQHDGALVPTRETFDMTVPHGGAETESDTEVVQAAPRRRRTTSGTSTAPLAVLIALLLGLLTLWRQEKLQVGYCGVGQPSTDLAGVSIPPWAEFIRPQCEPCPAHAFCGEHLDTDCESDFVKRPHPLSLGGLIPLPPTCEPDGAKARRVQAVADRAISELREHTARYECGETPERALSEDQLKTILSSQRKKGMSREEFETLWNPALSEIRTSEEVVTSTNRRTGERGLRSTSLARIPLTCALRKRIRARVGHYLPRLIGLLATVAAAAYARHRFSASRKREIEARKLAGVALEALERSAGQGISVVQLRDDVLRGEFDPRRREWLWEAVRKKVESNSNVRTMVKESRTGDVTLVWEWIGVERRIGGETPSERPVRRYF